MLARETSNPAAAKSPNSLGDINRARTATEANFATTLMTFAKVSQRAPDKAICVYETFGTMGESSSSRPDLPLFTVLQTPPPRAASRELAGPTPKLSWPLPITLMTLRSLAYGASASLLATKSPLLVGSSCPSPTCDCPHRVGRWKCNHTPTNCERYRLYGWHSRRKLARRESIVTLSARFDIGKPQALEADLDWSD